MNRLSSEHVRQVDSVLSADRRRPGAPVHQTTWPNPIVKGSRLPELKTNPQRSAWLGKPALVVDCRVGKVVERNQCTDRLHRTRLTTELPASFNCSRAGSLRVEVDLSPEVRVHAVLPAGVPCGSRSTQRER